MANKTIRVTALTSGKNGPASRFRVRQHVPALKALDVLVADHCPIISQHARLPGRLSKIRTRYMPPVLVAQLLMNLIGRIPGAISSYRSDILWIERSFLPGLEPLVTLTRGPRVLDVDDAVWLMNPMGEKWAAQLARRTDAVIAGNHYLADWYSPHCKQIFVVPTAIDCVRFRPRNFDTHRLDDLFVVGWTGTSGNFIYLKQIETALARFLKDHPKARFLITADKRPQFGMLSESQIIFRPWTAATESEILHQMDVGIMPLANDRWTRGKCSFKMLQYMATALPIVASPVGMNNELFGKGEIGFAASTHDEWYSALHELYVNPTLRENAGRSGRAIVEADYSGEVVAQKLANIFRRLA